MKKLMTTMTLKQAIFLLVAGIILGNVFVFGMQYWNDEVNKDECEFVVTRFSGYEELKSVSLRPRVRRDTKEIAIYCANGERYLIDGVAITSELKNELKNLSSDTEIELVIHPNSDVILEFIAEGNALFQFEETMRKLDGEAISFAVLGIFMYLGASVGLCFTVYYIVKKRRKR